MDDVGVGGTDDPRQASDDSKVPSSPGTASVDLDSVIDHHLRNRPGSSKRRCNGREAAPAHRPCQAEEMERYSAELEIGNDVKNADISDGYLEIPPRELPHGDYQQYRLE